MQPSEQQEVNNHFLRVWMSQSLGAISQIGSIIPGFGVFNAKIGVAILLLQILH
jgi:hypothetical protein